MAGLDHLAHVVETIGTWKSGQRASSPSVPVEQGRGGEVKHLDSAQLLQDGSQEETSFEGWDYVEDALQEATSSEGWDCAEDAFQGTCSPVLAVRSVRGRAGSYHCRWSDCGLPLV